LNKKNQDTTEIQKASVGVNAKERPEQEKIYPTEKNNTWQTTPEATLMEAQTDQELR